MLDGRGSSSDYLCDLHDCLQYCLDDSQVVDHATATLPREGQRIRDAFTCWGGDAEGQVAFAAQSKAGTAWSILDEQGRIQLAAHDRHVTHVARVDDAGVSETVLEFLGQLDTVHCVAAASERYEWHHLFFGHEVVVCISFAVQQVRASGYVNADHFGQGRRVLTNHVSVQDCVSASFLGRAEGEIRQLVDLLSIQQEATVTTHRSHQLVEDRIDGEDFFLTDA